MKKLFVLLLAAMMIMSLAACGGNAADEQMITRATEAPGAAEAETPAETVKTPGANQTFGFVADGVKLVPGAAFDASRLPEASSTYEAPSCAVEGMNVVYNYDSFELTTYDEGNGEIIYSIYLLDPNITTPEGLALGDDAQTARDLLGEAFEEEGSAITYRAGKTMLCLVLEDDTVASIEYRLDIQ